MKLTFLYPVYLWLLISIPLLIITHFFVLKHLKTRAWKFANFEAIKRVTGGAPSLRNTRQLSKNISLLIIKIAVLTIMILAIAGPIFWYTGRTSQRSFVVAIDASSSMLAEDISPTRFLAAKEAATEFVNNLRGDARVGVVAFAGTSYVEQQVTEEKKRVTDSIKDIQIKPIGGTDLGEAITTSVNILVNEEKSKSIILLTDGRSNVGGGIDEGIEYAKSKWVTVHTIGVGTIEGGSFIKGDLISTLDEEGLKRIAASTDGVYYRAENKEDLVEAYKEIAGLRVESIPVRLQLPLIMIALALIFVEWGLVNTRYRTLP